jgi:hypothetical protein
VLSGQFVTQTAGGQLQGLPVLGYVSVGFFLLTVLLAAELRSAAPHVSIPAGKSVVSPPTEAAA